MQRPYDGITLGVFEISVLRVDGVEGGRVGRRGVAGDEVRVVRGLGGLMKDFGFYF